PRLLVSSSASLPALHSFPTRRSSDLDLPTFYARLALDPEVIGQFNHPSPNGKGNFDGFTHLTREADERMSLFEHKGASYDGQWRSEEHTSELQSRFDLVCRLLLEKKK